MAGAQSFSYQRSVAPSMWMILSIMMVELVVIHPLIALWSVPVAVVLSVLSLGGIGWLLWCVRSFARLPVVLKQDELVMRAGTLKSCRVALTDVVGVTDEFDKADVEAKGTLNLALLAWPNVLVELSGPFRRGGRSINRIAHRLDDAPAFLTALGSGLDVRRG